MYIFQFPPLISNTKVKPPRKRWEQMQMSWSLSSFCVVTGHKIYFSSCQGPLTYFTRFNCRFRLSSFNPFCTRPIQLGLQLTLKCVFGLNILVLCFIRQITIPERPIHRKLEPPFGILRHRVISITYKIHENWTRLTFLFIFGLTFGLRLGH